MVIEGKAIVEWSFISGNQTLIVKYECYYVPDYKVLLIKPQLLFKYSTGITGELICNEDNYNLKL